MKKFLLLFIIILFILFSESCGNENPAEKVGDTEISANRNSYDTIKLKIIHNNEIPPEDSFPQSFQYEDSLPFVGVKSFETRSGYFGKSTPRWYVEIKANRDVYFYYTQSIKLADGALEGKGKYKAGKFRKIIKVVFQDFVEDLIPKEFPRYYVITPNYIYEVDSVGHQIYAKYCCGILSDSLNNKNTSCYCEGDLWIPQKEELQYLKTIK